MVHILDYSLENVVDYRDVDPAQCKVLEESDSPAWIRVEGLHDPSVVSKVLENYDIHPLIQQDVLNTTQPAKLDEFDDYLFLTARMRSSLPEEMVEEATAEQHFAMVLTERVIITFQEAPTAIFDPVILRLKERKGRLRSHGPDFLAWALLDAIMDHMLRLIANQEDEVAEMERALMDDAVKDPGMQDFYDLRRRSLHLYRDLRPLREVVSRLLRVQQPLLTDPLQPYLRDLYDHAWHAMETADHVRESISALREFHQSVLAHKMNKVMKVLTGISTIFLPLTFIAGVYGMNFRHQPELEWKYGYPAVWGVFLLITLLMLRWFKKNRWL